MNRNLLIATAVAAGASALVYFIRRRKKPLEQVQHLPSSPSRHLTDAFSKAKQHAVNENNHGMSMSDKL